MHFTIQEEVVGHYYTMV